MLNTLRNAVSSTSVLLALSSIVLLSPQSILAQPTVGSPDLRYEAMRVGSGKDLHYVVRDVSTNRTVVRTFAEFPTANDVKAGFFSSDSKEFAAAYHYSHDGNYTWVGIWDLQSGKLSRTVRIESFVRDLSSVFKQKK